MQEKQQELLQILEKSTKPVSGRQLAKALDVSSRTIINYVKSINTEGPIISSTPEGYIADKKQLRRLLAQDQTTVPQTYRERSFYIIRRFLLDNADYLDLYELCDELYISYSLLKNDIQKMNVSFAFLHIRFYSRDDCLYIQGSEKDKRKLMNHIIQQTQGKDFVDTNVLKTYFHEKDISQLLSILNEVHADHAYYLNDFARSNLLIHLLIMVSRLRCGDPLPAAGQAGGAAEIPPDDSDYLVATDICRRIGEDLRVSVSDEDALQVYFLVKSNSTFLPPDSLKELEDYLDPSLLKTIRDITRQVEKKYSISLESDHFLATFTLHLKNLILRNQNGSHLNNPIKDDLRQASPFLYDVALHIIAALQQAGLLTRPVDEDETSFIVLHLYAEIERQNQSEKYVRCLLVIPNYLRVEETICQKLLSRFGDQIVLTRRSALSTQAMEPSFDFLVTTLKGNPDTVQEIVHISPLLTEKDITAVSHAIDRVQYRRSLSYLTENFHYYFSACNFLADDGNISNRDQAIIRLSQLLESNRCVDNGFCQSVLAREQAVSTAYDGFAIPHAVDMKAQRNAIAVLISPKGIPWGGRLIHVVFLMAISPDTLVDFQLFYQTLALLLTETDIIRSLSACETFADFQETLLDPRFIWSINQ